jgi:hypothetical protein
VLPGWTQPIGIPKGAPHQPPTGWAKYWAGIHYFQWGSGANFISSPDLLRRYQSIMSNLSIKKISFSNVSGEIMVTFKTCAEKGYSIPLVMLPRC